MGDGDRTAGEGDGALRDGEGTGSETLTEGDLTAGDGDGTLTDGETGPVLEGDPGSVEGDGKPGSASTPSIKVRETNLGVWG